MLSSASPSPGRRVGSVENVRGFCSAAANGMYCGRSVTKLYSAGRLFACRQCYRLAYASQQESAHRRGLGKSQKIRMRLGGSPKCLRSSPISRKACTGAPTSDGVDSMT